jgi:hypothetical protein
LDQIIATYAPLADGGKAAAVIYTSHAEATPEVERAQFEGSFPIAIVPATEWLNRTVDAFMLRKDPATATQPDISKAA